MKKSEKENKKEVMVTKTSPKVIAIFFGLLVLEAVLILSSTSETITTSCRVDGNEYTIKAQKTKGIPWLLSLFNREGISYEKCSGSDCESFHDKDLNEECFKRSDLDESISCARRHLCVESKESSY